VIVSQPLINTLICDSKIQFELLLKEYLKIELKKLRLKLFLDFISKFQFTAFQEDFIGSVDI
jgi:hypothetical protein